jgi:4-amino-4-deoxy-L-arabinose transferase-like glycosyltransferase
LLVGFLPWLSVCWQSVRHGVRLPRQTNRFAPVILLLVWTGFIFFFFSISESKLISYILPVAPAIALLLGLYLPHLSRAQVQRLLLGYAVLCVLLAVATTVGIYVLHPGDERTPYALYAAYGIYLYGALALTLLGLAVAARINRQATSQAPQAPQQALLVFAASWFLMATVAGNGHEVFGKHSSGALLAPAVRAEMARLPADTPIYMVTVLDHTLPFYLRHTMIMVANPDELAFGVAQEPSKWLPSVAAWRARWLQQPYALAVMPPELYDTLVQEHLPMQVVARDERRVVVAKPPAP